MYGLWWGAALFFTGIGALFYWGGRALSMAVFYRDACLFLLLALICAGLGYVAP
jgi:hypothetical protein